MNIDDAYEKDLVSVSWEVKLQTTKDILGKEIAAQLIHFNERDQSPQCGFVNCTCTMYF